MKKLFLFSVVIILSSLTSCRVLFPKADLILYNGNVITLEASSPHGTAIAIKGDRILSAGDLKKLDRFRSDQTRMIDLKGQTAIPGFIEGHGHFISTGNALSSLDLTSAHNWKEIVQMVAKAAKKAKPGEWITGRGWHQEKWDTAPAQAIKGYPRHNMLSHVSPDNPVMLSHASGHAVFANAKAMELAGINAATPNPDGGVIMRDKKGAASGLFSENAAGLIYAAYNKALAELKPAEREARIVSFINAAEKECLQNGITTFCDAGASITEMDLFKKLARQGKLNLHLWVMISSQEHITDALLTKYGGVGLYNNMLTIGAIKQYADGALGSRGAWMLKPYSDMPNTSGQNVTPLDSIRRVAGLAYKHGFQLCTHAIGDRANRETLNIYEKFLQGDTTRRWRIEHAQHLSLQDIPRFATLGVIASMQTIHCTSDGPWVPERIGDIRARDGAYVWQKLLKSGARLANGTDSPVERVNPIANYYAAVTRKMSNGKSFYPDQALSRMQALQSLTKWNAYANFEETIKGTLAPGKLADITVLSQDLLTVPEDKIQATKVTMTIVSGKIKFKQ